jgi:DNA-binding transcriptional MocR family regulator
MKTSITRRRAVKDAVRDTSDGRIADALRTLVAESNPGARVPSLRELCASYRASPVTVHRAISQLAREGLVVARPGDGTYVARRPADTAPLDSSWQLSVLGSAPDPLPGVMFEPPSGLLLGTGYPDVALQPLNLLMKAARRASSRERAWDRVPPEGSAELRAWFARDVGGDATAADVLIVPGGQAALAATFRTLVPFGGPMIVESPTYFGALGVLRSLGLRAVPVAVDEHGMRTDLLEAALASSKARAVYLQPAFANPTGVSLSAARRAEVLELVARAGAFVIEDDYARDLAFSSAPPAPLFRAAGDHVIYIRSLTKSTAPGLRVAGIVARGPVRRRLRLLRAVEDWFFTGLLQDTALELVTTPAWQRHLLELRQTLRARQAETVRALGQHWPEARLARVPDGGFSLWLELPPGRDDLEFARAAAARGVQISPGSPWFAAEPPGAFIRISIASASTTDLVQGVELLGRVSRELGEGSRDRTTKGATASPKRRRGRRERN